MLVVECFLRNLVVWGLPDFYTTSVKQIGNIHVAKCPFSIRVFCVLSCFRHILLCVNLWTVACQAPPSMGFPRQDYWSGLLFPFLESLPNPGIKPASYVSPTGGFFTT